MACKICGRLIIVLCDHRDYICIAETEITKLLANKYYRLLDPLVGPQAHNEQHWNAHFI